MSIRRQILLLPIVISLIACALMAAGMFWVGGKLEDVSRVRNLNAAEERMRSAIEAASVGARDRALLIAGLPQVQAAMAARDDAALEAIFAPNWPVLRDETGVAQFQFHLAPATSLIRIHKLEKRGDDLSGFRKTVVTVNETGKPVAALESGKAGIGARGVAPVFHEGKQVGSVEIGLNIGQTFFDALKAQTGSEYEYFGLLGDGKPERLAFTVDERNPLNDADFAALRAGETVDKWISHDGADYVLRATPVRDFSGDVVGAATVELSADELAALRRMIWQISLGLIAAAFVVSGVIAWIAGGRITRPIGALARATDAIAKGDTQVKVSGAKRRDELGEMARALQVFAENIERNAEMQESLRLEEENARKADRARQEEVAQAEEARRAEAEAAQRAEREAEAVEQAALRQREEESRQALADQKTIVNTLAAGLDALARGDLGASLDHELPGEYEKLRHDFNAAVAQLAASLSQIDSGARHIDGEARAIANSADELSAQTERNAATLEQTAAALNELTVSVQSAAEGAQSARDLASDARGHAESGSNVVDSAVAAMAEIETSAKAISRITSVIDDIAFQTNLLALNAGVEAARAGEAGRGFAVVASEVRALAQRSSEAAKEISELISSSDRQVQSGVSLVGQTGAALARIVGSVREIHDRVSEIAASSGEQANGIAEINTAVHQLDQATQRGAAMFDRSAAASRAMLSESAQLIAAVSSFTLPQRDGTASAA
ncbi:hypothetical protein B6V73_01710 [Thioclava sp. JM3]|uniref:methyl-accepting chemotaxis protein n=1 Tax=unclassified Thioclava TaxID=2621713 RepID=UPI000B548A1A|nr:MULTISPECIES: methyl-accepting chemotaxis protein [unclassified Thioclava]OWY15315.1 hypothetical protein B6V72_01620 [Thioclava sp. F34-6]OWY18539.1 hypothetical protein B6V73_01710 [Thioclava sp. JM3]PWE50543.1 methyl-accepting chemotaxis protein [Thioclava sp. NG1]